MPTAVVGSAASPQIQGPLSKEAVQRLPALIPRKKRIPTANPVPLPSTPALPAVPNLSQITPVEPSRRILSDHDLQTFTQSPTYQLILAFIFTLSESGEDQKISVVRQWKHQPITSQLLGLLDAIDGVIDAHPPKDQGQSRFGNPAFRDFIDALNAKLPQLHESLGLPEGWSLETSAYLADAFGSRARIDYGSGHELHFAMWLLCLNRLSVLPPSTFAEVSLLVFPRYIQVLRRIQSTYYLEPAGSHGVWGLDDYHFLPFLFGASQLLRHPYITPKGIHNELILEEEGDEYVYLDMVRWTVSTKTVKGLKWTQPMLDDISGAKNWEKVEQGMRRMFVKEVLGKLPIMQHFIFGTLIPAAEGMSKEEEIERVEAQPGDGHGGPGHVHRDDTWGDCCGIKIPSIVAASQEASKTSTSGLRRVPFD